MKITLAVVLCTLLGGCSSFKLGAICYLPYGMGGNCQIIPVPAPSNQGAV